MKTRLISAAILLPVLFLVIWILPKVVCAIAIALLSAGAAYELLYKTGLVRHVRLVAYSALAAFLVPLWCHWGMSHAWGLLGLMAFVFVLFSEMLVNHVKVRLDKIAICFVAGIILPYLLSAIVRILDAYTGREVIIIPMILAFLPDSGAYFVGIRFGKRKLAPVVSPNKTVEGAIGGAATAIIGMLIYALVMDLATSRDVSYGLALLYGVLGAVAGVFGDLMFSAIKRQTGIKDYSNLLPGHGGILDRFDSMMTVAPLAEVLIILLPMVV